jgi:hypothetical protein
MAETRPSRTGSRTSSGVQATSREGGSTKEEVAGVEVATGHQGIPDRLSVLSRVSHTFSDQHAITVRLPDSVNKKAHKRIHKIRNSLRVAEGALEGELMVPQ